MTDVQIDYTNERIVIMDKRIIKTKRALKDALFSILKEKNFDSVTATEICKTADVSRNTFYNYYSDKYALLEDCFSDYEENFFKCYDAVQEKFNPENDKQKSFSNLIDVFFEIEDTYHTIPILSSFDLMEMYYRATMDILDCFEKKYVGSVNPAYDKKQLNSFLTLGFWGFIHGNPRLSKKQVKENSRKLVLDLLESPIFE